MFLFAMTLPRITTELDSNRSTYLAPSSQPAALRDQFRRDLASRPAFQREPLGWKYTLPPRSGIFRPCRNAEGGARDADSDGLVDNLIPASRWRKNWVSVDPAASDAYWSTRTPTEQEEALEFARRQTGMGSDFGRDNEPFTAACDRARASVPQAPYYGRH